MSDYLVAPGQKGPRGGGLGLFTWRNARAISSGDATSVRRYLDVYGGRYLAAAGTVANQRFSFFKAARAGTLRNLLVRFGATPGVATTFTIYVDGSPTALSVTASTTAFAINTTTAVAVAQDAQIECVASYTSGTPNNTTVRPQVIVTLL